MACVWPGASQAEPIRGAGSTFAAPIIQQWGKAYTARRADGADVMSTDWLLDYEPVGSLAGIMRLAQPEMDFAATDTPFPPEELARRGYRQFPVVIGAVAVVVNLGNLPSGRLKLSGPLLADIFLGKITRWSDLAIREVNPDLTLPDLPIAVMRRQDGSGSTANFTEYLSAVSPEWKAKVGSDVLVKWPVGTGAEGTQGLVRAVSARNGSIGYLEYGQLKRAGLSYALLLNRAGQFIAPEATNAQAAADAVDWAGSSEFNRSLLNQPGRDSYPLTAATFVVTPDASRSAARTARVHALFDIAFDEGAAAAARLGYVPLPASLVLQIRDAWKRPLRTGG
ncbi:MAG: phosphate ABC transporter substrate-binding protein PstS [Bosea sp. (in: a-proteobacteria)]